MAKKKKLVTMLVTVSVPAELTAAQARKEVRTLINDQAFWGHQLTDDPEGDVCEFNFRATKVAPVSTDPKIKEQVAKLYCAAGCNCCRNDEEWSEADNTLAEMLGVPKYADGSGNDWYAVKDALREREAKKS